MQRAVRLWVTKDAEGQRTDREYRECAIRAEADIDNPLPWVEPTSRANAFSWIIPRSVAGVPGLPTVNTDPRRVANFLTAVARDAINIQPQGSKAHEDEIVRQLMMSQHSSFIATRHGLCRIRSRAYTVQSGDPPAVITLQRQGIIPWGAASTYPSWFSAAPQLCTTMLPSTNNNNHPFVGSGCLPLFFMDQPHPWVPPKPSVLRNKDRFGDTVRLKFRELNLVIEEFPYTGFVSGDAWNDAVAGPRAHLTTAHDREPDRVRIIIFSRPKSKRSPDVGEQILAPPVFPPLPAGSLRADDAQPYDNTWDTPAHGEKVFTYPSKVKDSFYTIHEDVVLKFPPFKKPGYERVSSSNTTNPAYPHYAPYLFKDYGTGNVSATEGTTDRGHFAALDADGLPHTTRKLYFKRRFRDDGRKLSWSVKGMQDTHEGTHDDELSQSSSTLLSGASEGILEASSLQESYEIDMCEREMFVTVVTGAYLENRAHIFPGTPTHVEQVTIHTEGENKNAAQALRDWNLSPRNVCHPALVSVHTKMWFADEGMEGRPDDIAVVDDAGNKIGRVVVGQRDPHLPGEFQPTPPYPGT